MRDWDFFLVPYSGDSRGLRVSVHLERAGDELRFRYRVEGNGVKHVPFGAGSRRDELWKTTCFEFFLGRPDESGYFEVNMATSGDWNVYAFDSYREGMRRVEGVKISPLQSVHSGGADLELTGRLSLVEFPLVGPVVLGATAVVEYLDGTKDYWALAHKGEKPDFHVRDSFIAKV
jgi:hypothetical protein